MNPQPSCTLSELLDQEKRLTFPRFDNDTAIGLGLFLLDLAQQRSLPITIDIGRGQQQLFHAALPGTSADNDAWVKRKVAVVQRFGHSSYYMGQSCAEKGVSLAERFILDPLEFAAHGGCFPVMVEGTGMVGTVTVSGLPQVEDHAFLVEALTLFLDGRAGR